MNGLRNVNQQKPHQTRQRGRHNTGTIYGYTGGPKNVGYLKKQQQWKVPFDVSSNLTTKLRSLTSLLHAQYSFDFVSKPGARSDGCFKEHVVLYFEFLS